MSDFRLIQHAYQPSCICHNVATLIDHVITTDTLNASQSIQATSISDHYVQIVDVEVITVHYVEFSIWTHSLKKSDWDEVRLALNSVPWHVMYAFEDIDDNNEFFFHGILLKTINCLHHLREYI